MSIFTPPYAPSYGTPVSKVYRRLEPQFGDGYEQYVPDGLNNIVETWELTWNNISDENVDIIENQLDSFAGGTFAWTTPKGQTKKFTCVKASRTFTGFKTCSFNATFVQSFS